MFRRFRTLILNSRNLRTQSAKKLLDAKPRRAPPAMVDTVQEVSIYIHRFHNLDLFQQGWYQIKIKMRWEDSESSSSGTPSRVVQYEDPDLGSEDNFGIWKIDDADNSFYTQPFRIKYARQDVLLSVMVSFDLSLGKHEGPSKSAVILKFELLYAPLLENGSGVQGPLDVIPAAVHEFRIPPKALLGLHSYCPVNFDAFHAVLVDLSVHIILLKATARAPLKVSSERVEDAAGECFDGNNQNQVSGSGVSVDPKHIGSFKALMTALCILLDELHRISKGINQTIDLTSISSNLAEHKLISSPMKAHFGIAKAGNSGFSVGAGVETRESQNRFEKLNGSFDFESDGMLQSATKEDLLNAFHSLGDQLLILWNVFLKFHRDNKTKVMEFLREAWASDRRSEWSIWMVYAKVEMPHHYLKSGVDDSSQSVRGTTLSSRKLNVDPIQSAVTRADLHRRSIGQMRINNRSVQDMYIFGEPLRIPVVLVDRVVNAPLRTTSGHSYFSPLDHQDTSSFLKGAGLKTVIKSPGTGGQKTGRILRIVVFVHGFQGHHLDLRLVRNQWLLIDPGIECLMSEVNEDRTSGDFRDMGSRLAGEVAAFVRKKMDKVSKSGGYKNIKLNFVGHSIGNVIIRTALTEGMMEPFLKYLCTYMSVSGPHLGYLYSSNSLFNSGLWILKKLKGSQCIHQLTFTDDPDLENTFFYKLCQQKTLDHFKNIILLSSPQDGYVPYHSARIEMCQASLENSKKAKIFMEMLNNCLDQIRAPSTEPRIFMRCDVNFDISNQGRNLNTMIGRAAHIEFLESDIFARFIMWSFPELFR